MTYLKKFIIIFFCLFCTQFIYTQEHEHNRHEHLQNEIGFSSGVLYAFGHKEWGYGTHLHYFRMLGMHSKWSLGGSIEHACVDGNHFNVGAGVKYQLFDRLSISALPGVTILSHNGTETHNTHDLRKALFSLHFELVYDLFHWEKFHLGTVLDYSWEKNDSHTMLGIHAAFCF